MKIKFAIVGAGNISNTRHIPALKKNSDAQIVGVLSNNVDKARLTAKKHGIKNFDTLKDGKKDGGLSEVAWLNDIDGVIIGAPPHLHFKLAKMFLNAGKHVLVEKPMMMNDRESQEIIQLAKDKGKVFYVMHNFQYAAKMQKLNAIIKSKAHGDIISIIETQVTNHDRRLPEWYNSLPMGLFYDEAAHFLYLLEKHAGKVSVDSSHAVYDTNPKENTPVTLSVNAHAGKVPVTMLLNFHAPICEWHYIVNFKKRVFIYDFFKDILIDLPTDNEHLAKDILKNSLIYTWQYWTQFIGNGFKMITGNLLYGHDVVVRKFTDAILGGAHDVFLDGKSGADNVRAINDVVNRANKRKK